MSRKTPGAKPQSTPKHRNSLIYDVKILRKIWKLQPALIIMAGLWALIWAGIDSVAVYFRNAMFNALDVSDNFMDVAIFIFVLGAFYLFFFIPDHIYNHIFLPIMDRNLRAKMHAEMYEKARRMDLACYDDPDFYNEFVWAMRESDAHATAVLSSVFNIIHRTIATFAITALLLTINVWMGIIMFIGITVSFLVDFFADRLWVRYSFENNPLWRRSDYIKRTFYLSDYAKEMRTTRSSEMLLRDYDENNEAQIRSRTKYGKKFALFYGIGYNIVHRVTSYATILIMIGELHAGRVLIGGFAAAVTALGMLNYIMVELAYSIMELPKHALYLEKYFAYLEHENSIVSGDIPVPAFESLTFEHVTFSYSGVKTAREIELQEAIRDRELKEQGRTLDDLDLPEKSERPDVLRDVSFTVRRGEKIAIVGYNGAGKTTLIKLMMRLYDPTEGRILYNGRDIREYDLDEYRDRIGAVFQDYRLFAATVGENVMGTGYDKTPENEATIREALDNASFTDRLSTLEKGLDTPLCRDIDKEGVNLSGGEAQKVAIARVFVRPYDLIIMDEPSSALDPVAEYELNHSILNAADSRDRTVIFISHRLSTTRFAGRILLFADGRLAEEGSHDDLLCVGGKYAEMFRMQAEKYRRGEAEAETA